MLMLAWGNDVKVYLKKIVKTTGNNATADETWVEEMEPH